MNIYRKVFVVVLSLSLFAILFITGQDTKAASSSDNRLYLPMLSRSFSTIGEPFSVVRLTDVSLRFLVSISDDGVFYTFSQTTDELSQVAVGDTIVGDPTDLAPAGFVRRVIGIARSGDRIIFATEEVEKVPVITPMPTTTPLPETTATPIPPEASGITHIVSWGYDGYPSNGGSDKAVLAGNGKSIAFSSTADNLVADDRNYHTDIFVYDMGGSISLVSQSSEREAGNRFSDNPSISNDGRFVTFDSAASNLVPGDTNNSPDIFVYDRLEGETRRISVADDKTQGNSDSWDPTISADGSVVVYVSWADNLVPADNNYLPDIFAYEMKSGKTTRISVGTGGKEANGESYGQSISANGQFVVFHSMADNIVHNDTNSTVDVFVHDRIFQITERISVVNYWEEGNGPSINPSISANGLYIVFSSHASNLVAGDTNNEADYIVHNRISGEKVLVSVGLNSEPSSCDNQCWSFQPAISNDGQVIAFVSGADNLVPRDNNGQADVFVRDMKMKETTRVSVSTDKVEANGYSFFVSMSSDGTVIAFSSYASNLVTGDVNGIPDIFYHDRRI